ncbi:hypothetical protein VU08_05490 [Desulfobulbus sp. F5]|nr:hypothetical protein [Desulfobulbus sp. F5]
MIYEKVLLVEGDDEKWVLPEFIEKNGVTWEDKQGNRIVEIKPFNGKEKLNRKLLNIELKASGLKILGIILDADEYPSNRWKSIRNCLTEKFPDIPEQLPQSGLIHHGEIKVGVWMMPDNQEQGMLETFLQFLLPENGKALWQFTEQSCQQAKEQGACFKDCHSDKAKIHTWLAWQNPPGRQLRHAIKERILSPASPQAAVFMQWFKKLFEV